MVPSDFGPDVRHRQSYYEKLKTALATSSIYIPEEREEEANLSEEQALSGDPPDDFDPPDDYFLNTFLVQPLHIIPAKHYRLYGPTAKTATDGKSSSVVTM